MSLALSTLIYEWRRYMAAVVALAFAGLLILALLGLFMGIGKSFSASIDRSRADVFILGPKAEGLDGASGVPRRVIPQIYMHPEVVEAVDLDSGGGRLTNQPKDGGRPKQNFVRLVAVDPRPGAVNLPTDYSEEVRQALLEPYALVVDETALKTLGVEVGDKATYNGRTVKIAATITGYSNFFQPQVVASRDRCC
jgi:putative ABC transport system permease protein